MNKKLLNLVLVGMVTVLASALVACDAGTEPGGTAPGGDPSPAASPSP